jgi:hypothetical protein
LQSSVDIGFLKVESFSSRGEFLGSLFDASLHLSVGFSRIF